jgi:hypothetical protein
VRLLYFYNVHAAFIILIGAVLVALKHEQAGLGLMMSGAAIFTHKS